MLVVPVVGARVRGRRGEALGDPQLPDRSLGEDEAVGGLLAVDLDLEAVGGGGRLSLDLDEGLGVGLQPVDDLGVGVGLYPVLRLVHGWRAGGGGVGRGRGRGRGARQSLRWWLL